MSGDQHSYPDRSYDLGKHLLTFRLHTDLTQAALAAAVGVHPRTVQNWETGVSAPKAETLRRLIETFLRLGAFTTGRQREDAQELWELVEQHAPRQIAAFDEPWFARLLAQYWQEPAPAATAPRALIDWGEAIAPSTLYGREAELATLRHWLIAEQCQVVLLLGLAGVGKSSLAVTLARQAAGAFELALFRSLQNGPPLGELLDQLILAVSAQQVVPPERTADKIALLVQLFRDTRCLLILDNFETLLQPQALAGEYRTGYAEYGILLDALSQREHRSCLVLTSREKPAELGRWERQDGPVRAFALQGLDQEACRAILEARQIGGEAATIGAVARLYGGNPLALQLLAEPVRELFGGDIGAFLAADGALVQGVVRLLEGLFLRSSALEQMILRWLAVERETLTVQELIALLREHTPQRAVLAALESLRRRMLIERAASQPAFSLQPVILEFVTEHLVEALAQEISGAQPELIQTYALVRATAKEYVRHSQERLLATPLLERLGVRSEAERRLVSMLERWRGEPLDGQGYGPGNVTNLLRLLRGHLRGLDLSRLALRQVCLQDVDAQDTRLAGADLQNVLWREGFDTIQSLAVSANGAYWAAADDRGHVRLWNTTAFTLHRIWANPSEISYRIALSPDGRSLAGGGWEGTVMVWDTASGRLRWSSPSSGGQAVIVLFSPDGAMLAGSREDGIIQIWDADSGALLQAIPHEQLVYALSWRPDSRALATGDLAGAIRLWELRPDEPTACRQTLSAHTQLIASLAFAPNGATLASASWDGSVKLWEAASGEVIATLAHPDQVSRVAWSPDGRTLATASADAVIRLWDAAQRSVRLLLTGHTKYVRGLAFTPDGRSLVSGGGDGTLRIWEAGSGYCTQVIHGHGASLTDIDWSPDGTQLVSGGVNSAVTIWDWRGARAPQILRGHTHSITYVAWSATGRWLASCDTVIHIWDASSGVLIQTLQHPNDPDALFSVAVWSPDGQRLACGGYNQGVLVWDMTLQRVIWVGAAVSVPTAFMHWSPDGASLAEVRANGSLSIWRVADGALLHYIELHAGTMNTAWSPDGAYLAICAADEAGSALRVLDSQHGKQLQTIVIDSEAYGVIAWGASAEVVITGGIDGGLRWWDIQRGKCVRVRNAHQDRILSLKRSPDGSSLASCSYDGSITLWDLQTGEQLATLRHDRPYERMDITGLTGISDAQRTTLIALGAIDTSAP